MRFWRRKTDDGCVRLREPTDDFVLKTLVPLVLLILASGPISVLDETPVWLDVMIWLGLAGLVLMLVRTWRMGIYVRRDEIEIVGVWSRDKVKWNQISEFTMGYPESRMWSWAPVAELADGTRLPMHAIQAPQPWTRPSNQFADRAVAKLDELLIKARSHGGAVDVTDLEFERRFGY